MFSELLCRLYVSTKMDANDAKSFQDNLSIFRFALEAVTIAVSSFYKSFGLTFGDNLDQTLSTIGAVRNQIITKMPLLDNILSKNYLVVYEFSIKILLNSTITHSV